ncbi:MAG TPA: SGNH/GDSL hydrolase family protein [Polyangiales bacterium]
MPATDQDFSFARDADFAAEMAVVRSAQIYWNHQSIGGNLLNGLAQITQGVAPLHMIEVGDGRVFDMPAGGVLAHSLGGHNGQPAGKIEAFENTLDTGLGFEPRLAMMKLCFVDFDASTDVDGLFARYAEMVARVRQRHPLTKIVHITTPLQVQETGWKAQIKGWTGLKDFTAKANIQRNRYNELMRKRFAKDPMFDLARLESTWPDGHRETFSRSGASYESLVPLYASDGAHLNAYGQRHIARQWVHAMATALR